MAIRDGRFSTWFGHYGWPWPTGALDDLLKAALTPDPDRAIAHAFGWLDRHDIATATFPDHRLLTAVAARFGKALSQHPSYPRLTGLRRQLWTKSRIAADEAKPTLQELADAGVPLLLTKGAARVAIDPAAATRRVAHDIDVVVPAEHLAAAVAIMARGGWQPSSGASLKLIASRLPSLQAMNFFRGSLGDIDLHRDAYPGVRDQDDEARLWRQSVEARFHDVPVRVPSPADRAALAIAHGAQAAHAHSDWLVDCAVAVHANGFTWSDFGRIVRRRDLAVPAVVVLGYLDRQIHDPVPGAVLDQLLAEADRSERWARFAQLLEMKPRGDTGASLQAVRWFAKKSRQRIERRSREAGVRAVILRGRKAYAGRLDPLQAATTLGLSHPLRVPGGAFGGSPVALTLLLEVAAPALARRVEMEINSGTRHIVRLRYRKLGKRPGLLRLRYAGLLQLDPADADAVVEARPIRQVREGEAPAAVARFGALPFRLLKVEVGTARAQQRLATTEGFVRPR